jgi:NosR/NirI family transcriptional regulator, nitrous oxide reductase regulator
MKRLRMLLCLILLLGAGGVLIAGEVIPVPSFTSYELPETQNPAPRVGWYDYLDLAALATGLVLASYFALWARSRRGLLLLAIASLAWLGFWRQGCVCPIGAIQNVTLGLTDPSYTIPLVVVAFFALPLVFTLFFGRTFCAAVCPLGAVQELVALRPIKVPRWLDHALGLFAYVYLGLAVLLAATGTAFLICRYDPFVAIFRHTGSVNMLILAACFLLVGVFVGRPYCRYLCPYGAILGLLSKVAKWHVQIPPKECIQCRLCEEACPYGAIQAPTVLQSAAERPRGRRRLVLLASLLPVLIALGALLGSRLEGPLGRLHPAIRQAERVYAEDSGNVQGSTDASDVFRATGRPVQELYREAHEHSRNLAYAGSWFGAWVGLVLGAKLIHLSIRRRRSDYQPERTNCVACGRCFWYCPSEQLRLGLIGNCQQPTISPQPPPSMSNNP